MMKKIYMLMAFVLCLTFALGVAAAEDSTYFIPEDRTDIVFLVDSSGTLFDEGIAKDCENALNTFADLLPLNSYRVGAVFYGNTWNVGYSFGSDELSQLKDDMGSYALTRICRAYDMTALDSHSAVEEFKSVLSERIYEERYTHGNNYLGGGLMAALDLVADSDEAAVVIISDGILNGFDSTDGVEWKKTNRELLDEGLSFAKEKGIKLYTLELNCDGRNNSTSTPRKLMSELASETGGLSRIISTPQDFKESVAEIYADLSGGELVDGLSFSLSELTSQVSIVIDGVDRVTVNGKSYKKGESDKIYFTDDVFRINANSEKLNITLGSGSMVKAVVEEGLLPTISLDSGSVITRNEVVNITAYLSDPNDLSYVPTHGYFAENDVSMSVNGEKLEAALGEVGYVAQYSFEAPGRYILTASLGGKEVSGEVEVRDYELTVEAEDNVYSDEIVRVSAKLVGVSGKLEADELYGEGEAFLTVMCDGRVIESDIPMSADRGYYADVTMGKKGEYSFLVDVKSKAAQGSSYSAEKKVECTDAFERRVVWSEDDNARVNKSDSIKISAELIGSDGRKILNSRLLEDAKLYVERGSMRLLDIPFEVTNGALTAEWRINRAEAIKIVLEFADGETDGLSLVVTNHAPVLSSDSFEVKLPVGSVYELELSEVISDEDGDIFDVTNVGDSPKWTLSEDDKTILIEAGERSAKKEFVFMFDDGDVKVPLTCVVEITNEKPVKTAELEIPHFIIDKPAFMFFAEYADEAVSFDLDEHFSDPEGLELVYTLEGASELAVLDGSVLSIEPSAASSERLTLTVTDSSDESISVEYKLVIDEWWTLNLKRFVITVGIIVVVLILSAVIVRRESNIGYLRVASARRGEEELDLNEKLNNRRVRLWSLEMSKFIRNRVKGIEDKDMPKERGRIVGHLIFGRKVTLKDLSADGIEINGEVVEKKLPKKLRLGSGESITLVYGDIKVTVTNRN